MSTYFIADLHLSEFEPHITDLFLQFMAEKAPLAEAVYILGDLFDFWIGDDERSDLIERVQTAIHTITEKGIPCYFICGNRDFLLGKRFAKACGMTLLPDYQLIDLYGKKTLLCHGDTLCIDDVKYQKFRQKVHQKWRQWLFLCLPLKWRIHIAEKIRAKSKADKKGKSLQMMDVNPEFTAQKMAEFGAEWLIHGHTHRQAVHLFPPTPPTVGLPPKGEENVSQHFSQDSFLPPLGRVPDKVGGRGQIRIVLGDWGKTASILEVTADGFQFNEKR